MLPGGAVPVPGRPREPPCPEQLGRVPGGGPHFWLTDRAVALGASAGPPADVALPDGTPVWCDGGPLRFFDPSLLEGAALVHRICLEHGSLRPLGSNDTPAPLSADPLRAV